MANQATVSIGGRNPDVLTCIANLSSDEVFTPPAFANGMLDTLAEAWGDANDGASLWADKSVTFLDPCTKSGVFLREITVRLTDGLKAEIPDLRERVDHILVNQVFGAGITQLTSLIARRSLYCSKWANGPHSIGPSFDDESGNVWFESIDHTWVGADGVGRCRYCGASQKTLDRGEGFETHAYAFIHADNMKARIAELFGDDMQFDVIIGNPPYQLTDGGHNNSATPIYHRFVENAIALDPRYLAMVTPSRWFAGGRGLDKYRKRMLSDRRMRNLVDYPKLYDAFPGVKIRGGISYFLWDRDHDGPCTIQTMWEGQPLGPAVERDLGEFDVLVRRNEAVSILRKVRVYRVNGQPEPTLDARVSSQKPYGLRTYFHGADSRDGLRDPVKLYGSRRISWIERDEVPVHREWIDDYKVFMTRVQGTSAAVETQFLSRPIVGEPGTASTESYLVAGRFATKQDAERYAAYLRTRFVRFLVSLRKSTQDAARDVYAFVPDVPLDRLWDDTALYKRYALTDEEIAFIESQVAEHAAAVTEEAVDE